MSFGSSLNLNVTCKPLISNTLPFKSSICLHNSSTYFLTTCDVSSQLPPNIKKLSVLEATLLPALMKLAKNEQAVSFLPKGQPSPPRATRKVPSVSPNHLSDSLRDLCTLK